MKIGSITIEIMRLTSTFLDEMAKSAYLAKYLSNYWTDLHQIFTIAKHVYGDYKTDINFAVDQGTLLW